VFFLISKLIEFLFVPSNIIGILFVVGVAAFVLKRRRIAANFFILASLFLIVLGWTPLGPAALMTLENRFPQPVIDAPVAGVIMLGGAVDTHITSDRNITTFNDAGERLTATAELSRRYPDAKIFLSGGGSHIGADASLSESQVAKNLLVALGVPEGRIAMEERSRNTCENATGSLAALKPEASEHWLLITSASHMPRAVACFRAAGFRIVPYPVDYRTRGRADLSRPAASIGLGLDFADLAAHEWLGLLTYRMSGLTRDLFPAP
jgi:uncharacterized SAM-binding protein YcdF (DUF218 family)